MNLPTMGVWYFLITTGPNGMWTQVGPLPSKMDCENIRAQALSRPDSMKDLDKIGPAAPKSGGAQATDRWFD